MPDKNDYLNLITPYHRDKPKFSSMIENIIDPIIKAQEFEKNLCFDFDIDLAIGVQLDIVGQWVGRTRFIKIPIPNAWFSLDTALKGFDQGVWFRPFDTLDGITRLDDETYRTLLRAKIAANHWDGTLPTAKSALSIIFPNGQTKLVITDNQDMSITYGVSGVIPSALFIALLSQGYIPLKPEGVFANYLIATVNGPLFGFDVQNQFISGFDTGAWGAPPSYFI